LEFLRLQLQKVLKGGDKFQTSIFFFKQISSPLVFQFSRKKAKIYLMLETLYFEVEDSFHKSRLDDYLFSRIPHLSRMYLRYLIAEGRCEVNGIVQNTGYRLSKNDFIEIVANLNPQTASHPENIPLEIIFEDSEIIVLNKAAGMLAHPTKGVRDGTLLNALTFYLNFNTGGMRKTDKFIRIGLAHRLDKQTSGLMVIGKNARSHRILCSHFQRKLVEKKYFAVVEGVVEKDSGTICAPIARNGEGRFWHISDQGRFAESNFWVLERRTDSTVLELEPVTGRTNQLRLHCAHLRHPIIGDEIYHGRKFPRLCLHAYKLSFWHPNGEKRLEFVTDLPMEFRV
jgi:23S rRNA pseudouridine1911/1915/1917 synthase